MTIFIARDGSVIGEYPHTQLEAMARAGQLQPDDDYWHEGMGESWGKLEAFLRPQAWTPPEPAPLPADPAAPPAAPPFWQTLDPRLLYGGLAAAALLFLLLTWLIIKPDAASLAVAPAPKPTPTGLSGTELRDKAAADLRARIERLPATAKPPLNAFYYDIRVAMKKNLASHTPWSATLRGFENVVDPATDRTVTKTEFLLTADYEDGAWVFRDYSAKVDNLSEGTRRRTIDDESSPTPPAIAVALGLKRRTGPMTPPAIVPGIEVPAAPSAKTQAPPLIESTRPTP